MCLTIDSYVSFWWYIDVFTDECRNIFQAIVRSPLSCTRSSCECSTLSVLFYRFVCAVIRKYCSCALHFLLYYSQYKERYCTHPVICRLNFFDKVAFKFSLQMGYFSLLTIIKIAWRQGNSFKEFVRISAYFELKNSDRVFRQGSIFA